MSYYKPTTSQMREMSLREHQAHMDDDDSEYWYEDDARHNADSHIVELTMSCRNLTSIRLFSTPSPMIVLYKRGKRDWIESGRTQKISNTSDPDFADKFSLDYNFNEVQPLMFKVFTSTGKDQKLTENNLVGKITCSLGEIVMAQPRFSTNLRLDGSKHSKGQIIIISEQLQSCRETITMEWKAKNLDRKDFAGKSDPFMVFYKQNSDSSYSKFFQSEVIKHTLEPKFKKMEIPVSTFCNGDYDRLIKVEFYDWNRSGRSDTIGMFKTTLRRLSKGVGVENTYRCINPVKMARKKSYKSSGVALLTSFQINRQDTFVDFIRTGTEMSFIVAIDFSSSNIDKRWATSWHSDTPERPSQYHQAIQAVGNVIKYYDTDCLFPAYGFGAELPQSRGVSDLFALNNNEQSPSCEGVEGIIEAYRQTIKRVQLSEPTNFSPVIMHVSSLASKVTDASNYYVVLIITDGKVNDLARTKEAIFQAAKLPISIVIVGIGDGDFSDMNELDGDCMPLSLRGVRVDRDIVQFVPMREFLDPTAEEPCDEEKLAKEVLAEIPYQLVKYMKKKGFKPM